MTIISEDGAVDGMTIGRGKWSTRDNLPQTHVTGSGIEPLPPQQ
jgi:hypothetical protein